MVMASNFLVLSMPCLECLRFGCYSICRIAKAKLRQLRQFVPSVKTRMMDDLVRSLGFSGQEPIWNPSDCQVSTSTKNKF
mmetsp:Transcript_35652/g.63029  ORF Transcript_35652/g.63029 Transcript_35652/m.63029 type:complete len:80 (-) Transcript_35652:956-1195(-)